MKCTDNVNTIDNTIDYMLTSNPNNTIAFNVLDIDINLSHHIPIMVVCAIKNDRR